MNDKWWIPATGLYSERRNEIADVIIAWVGEDGTPAQLADFVIAMMQTSYAHGRKVEQESTNE